jgi:hypothetical protein
MLHLLRPIGFRVMKNIFYVFEEKLCLCDVCDESDWDDGDCVGDFEVSSKEWCYGVGL